MRIAPPGYARVALPVRHRITMLSIARSRVALALPLAPALVFVGTAVAQTAAPLDESRAFRRLNVLLVMSDQHSAQVVGTDGNGYGGAGESITPSLDQLAAEGVRFTGAFCANPLCSPSRFSVLTGRWSHQHGLRANGVWEPRGQVTFPRLARSAGYRTASFGKHHMAWLDQLEVTEDHGFDVVRDMGDYLAYCAANGQPAWSVPGNYAGLPGLPHALGITGETFNSNEFHPAGYFADEVIAFLEARADDEQPFVCWYAPYGPHSPILPSGVADPQDWANRFQPAFELDLPPNFNKVATTERLADLQALYTGMTDAEWRAALSFYYGLVSQIDWNIGRVIDRLDALGLAEETLVIYTSDHGEMASEMACWGTGAGGYDASGRIPMMARLPGTLPVGKVVDALASNVDLFPTMLELTGVPAPDAIRIALDGESLYDLMLADVTPAGWREQVFLEGGRAPNTRFRTARAVDAKYSFDTQNGGEEEFYDLAADPFEIVNRIDDPDVAVQAQIDELRDALDDWWNDGIGHAPEYPNTGDPDKPPVRASDPFPDDGATGIRTDVNPSWHLDPSVESGAVYFGTSPDRLSLIAEVTALEATVNVGTLATSTTYYWRVDLENGNGLSPGNVWQFTTETFGLAGPELPTAPFPAHRAEGVPRDPILRWTAAPDLIEQTILFAPRGEPLVAVEVLAADAESFAPDLLQGGENYCWRVDGTSTEGTTVGDVWRFTTDPTGLPGHAELIAPRHLDESVTYQPGTVLKWRAGEGAQSHDLYFGEDFPLAYIGNMTATQLATGSLQSGETYYWRVDAVNAVGRTRGFTWRFTME